MDVSVYINGDLRADLRCVQMKRSYVEPWSAELSYDGRHDDAAAGLVVQPYDGVLLRDAATGLPLFRGRVVEVRPGGVASEGVRIVCKDARQKLAEEPVRINGSYSFQWNRRGYSCQGGWAGEDSPGGDGGKWVCGEIAVDILEHALGLPLAGSDIPVHHPNVCCVSGTYLTLADIAGYDAAEWLALDSAIGEFSVQDTPIASALDSLVQSNGGFYGWYVDEWGVLRLRDLAALPETSVQAGELGHWQDEGGTNYRLLDNQLAWSLDGVYSRVVVQGTDRTVEVKPANLDGCANAALNGGGLLARISAPWRSFPAAYNALCQPYRRWTWKPVGMTGSCDEWWTKCECGVPAGLGGIHAGARVYRGTAAGAKSFLLNPAPGAPNWSVSLWRGIVMFYWDVTADLGPGEKLWGWYWASVPFTASAGPAGTAYDCFGYDRTLSLIDPGFKHPTSWPSGGMADDETAMGILAARLLEQVQDVRVQGQLELDGVAPASYGLSSRYNVSGLAAPTPGDGCWPAPLDWRHVGLAALEAVYDLEQNSTTLTVANTFWMLEGYSEMKQRFKLNAFAQRELVLSEDILGCQVQSAAGNPDDEPTIAEPTTPPPTPTTTEAPPPTTTEAPPPTTTEPPGPTTTAPPGGTTEAPPTSTTAPPPGTTTTQCPDCTLLSDQCYRIALTGSCDNIPWTGWTAKVEWAGSISDPDGPICVWSASFDNVPGSRVDLVFHPLIGWLITAGMAAWAKDVDPLNPHVPEGSYTCTSSTGTAEVTWTFCGVTTEPPGGTTAGGGGPGGTTAPPGPTTTSAPTTTPAPPTTTTAAPAPTTTTAAPTTSTTAAPPTTTTAAPPTTTTAAPPSTTPPPGPPTSPPGPTTTPPPGPTTTLPGTTTTAAPTTSTTAAPTTSTTAAPTTSTTAAPTTSTTAAPTTSTTTAPPGCPDTYYVTISTVPSTGCGPGIYCDEQGFAGCWELTGGPAVWTKAATPYIYLGISGGTWSIAIGPEGCNDAAVFTKADVDGCPPAGTYTWDGVSPCGAMTVILSTTPC